LITPEVGVKIIEGAKQKNGGNDFSVVFNKPSKYDYFSMMKDSTKINNTSSSNIYTSQMFLQSLDLTAKNDISLVHYNNKSNLPKEKSILKNLNSSGLTNSMTINRKIVSLKHSLDSLDHIPDYDDKLVNPIYMNNNNLFKNKKNCYEIQKSKAEKSSIESSLKNINSFNYSIVKNPSWGSIYENLSNDILKEIPKSHKKPSEREYEHELGKKSITNRTQNTKW